jgi:PAS domain S-box-containing protein
MTLSADLPSTDDLLDELPCDPMTIGTLIVSTIETSPVSFTLADARRRDRPLIYVNDAFCKTSGYSRREVLGRNCRFLQGPGTDDAAVDQLRQALAEGRNYACRLLNYRRDGTPFWNDLHITALRDFDGSLIAFAGIQVDITEQVLLERQQAHRGRLEAVGQLAAGLAHEINNLLQPMLGLPGLIGPALPKDAHEEREWLHLIEEHAAQARGVVLNVLSFAREAPSPRAACHDATAVFSRALDFVGRLLPTSIVIERHGLLCRGTPSCPVRLDETDARQVIANLLLNASQAMKGTGRIAVRLEETGRGILLTIRDDGPGMPAHVRQRIFEPFFTTKAVGEGTGLGLAVVHGAVQSWGGAIEVDSAPGEGATFSISVPKWGG